MVNVLGFGQTIKFLSQTKKYIISRLDATAYIEQNSDSYLLIKSDNKRQVFMFSKEGLCIVMAYDVSKTEQVELINELIKQGFKSASEIKVSPPGDFSDNAKTYPAIRYYNNDYVYSFFDVSVIGTQGTCFAVSPH